MEATAATTGGEEEKVPTPEAVSEPAPAPSSVFSVKQLVFILAGGMIFGGGGVLAFVLMTAKHAPPTPTTPEVSEKKPADPKTSVVTLPTVSTNLKGSKGLHSLKVTIQLESKSKKSFEDITKPDRKKYEISNYLVETFSECTLADVGNAAARTKLKRIIKDGINSILEDCTIDKVSFPDFVIKAK